jgi:putative glutamine amidotransferase
MNSTIIVTQREDYINDRNEWRDVLDRALIEFLIKSNLMPYPIPNSLIKKSGDLIFHNWLDELSPRGIVLSGGGDIVDNSLRHITENKLLEWALERDIPILGICRGMQVIAKYFGCNLHRHSNHVNVFHSLVFEENTNLLNLPVFVNSYHEWVIDSCPTNFKIIARSEDGVIEGIQSKDMKILGLMWHPEREDATSKCSNVISNFFDKV